MVTAFLEGLLVLFLLYYGKIIKDYVEGELINFSFFMIGDLLLIDWEDEVQITEN